MAAIQITLNVDQFKKPGTTWEHDWEKARLACAAVLRELADQWEKTGGEYLGHFGGPHPKVSGQVDEL